MTEQTDNTQPRIFTNGTVRFVEGDSMRRLDNEAIRNLLKTTYPEIANASLRERDENGLRVVEFLPQPER